MIDFSDFSLDDLLKIDLAKLDAEDLEAFDSTLEELGKREAAKVARNSLLAFCVKMNPDYKIGKHHKRLATLLEDMAFNRKDRIAVSIPPRHGKSFMVSVYFPAWFLGNFPDKKVLMVSHTTDLAVDFGRKVRNLVDLDIYKEIFPTVTLAADSKSAGRWNTNAGGEYFACGVGSALAGRGADFLIIDDPFSEQDILNGNFEVFQKAYEWFTFGARTRLMPGGRVAIVHCMVGDTGVLMDSGIEKPLRDVRPGDRVATYTKGKIATAKVLNWANQGLDSVYSIVLHSGVIIRANEKHPFLVNLNGVEQWIKVRDLKLGMALVSAKGATIGLKQKLSRGYAEGAVIGNGSIKKKLVGYIRNLKRGSINALQKGVSGYLNLLQSRECARPVLGESTTANTIQNPFRCPLDTEVNGWTKYVLRKAVNSLYAVKDCALHATIKQLMPDVKKMGLHIVQKDAAALTLKCGMGLLAQTTIRCLPIKEVHAQSAPNTLTKVIPQRLGKCVGWLSTTATRLGKSALSYVTCATLLSRVGTPSDCSIKPLHTLNITLDQIQEITLDGYEDVFDIQVEGTENFIANGVVSHNTRWHPSDLIGMMAKDMVRNTDSDQYEFFEFPAIFNEGSAEERALWPEFFDLDALRRTKASMPSFQWNAQYQQQPTSEEGALIKREWWMAWEEEDPPTVDFIIMTLDAAAEKNNRADFTALLTWGVFTHRLTGDTPHIILLNAINKRVEFPELKDLALQEYREWEPDAFIVEKKSNGTPLFQELRRMGIPVSEFTPHRGTGDKVARLNAVADIFRSGMVWYPAGRRWAEEVVEQVAAFPASEHDDMVDCTSMALARFRSGGFISLKSDVRDDNYSSPRKAAYY